MFRRTFGALRFTFRWTRRFTMLVVILGMLAFNVATLTVSGLNTIASGAIAAVAGAQATVAGRNAAKAKRAQAAATAQKRTARKISTRIAGRTARVAAANVASAAGEALPVAGIAVIAAATAYELAAACETMKDLADLDAALGAETTTDEGAVCGMDAPKREEIASAVVSAPGQAWERAKGLYADLPAMPTIELPDWRLPGWEIPDWGPHEWSWPGWPGSAARASEGAAAEN